MFPISTYANLKKSTRTGKWLLATACITTTRRERTDLAFDLRRSSLPFCRSIDPIPGNTLTVYMDVNGCPGSLNEIRYLEHIQCKISLRFFPRGNLRIDLTSPMGTTSTLLFERPRDVVSSNFDNWPFLSVHFWGEKAEGRWTLRIHNNGNRHVNQPGKRRRHRGALISVTVE